MKECNICKRLFVESSIFCLWCGSSDVEEVSDELPFFNAWRICRMRNEYGHYTHCYTQF